MRVSFAADTNFDRRSIKSSTAKASTYKEALNIAEIRQIRQTSLDTHRVVLEILQINYEKLQGKYTYVYQDGSPDVRKLIKKELLSYERLIRRKRRADKKA